MSKYFYTLLFLSLSSIAICQNNFNLQGKIIDSNSKIPLESATVYLTSVKDSTMINYSISDKNGNFTLKTKKNENSIFLKISFMGYKDFTQKIEKITTNIDFGIIEMIENATTLEGIEVISEIPPIRIKTDTLEFNAASFKVTPDANVEALLKQLPGVEIDDEGKITVNGKEVNNILVNGKPFFGKDGKIATQNLPAEIIDKVQVTETKTKGEELSGEAASSNESTINLTIQEDKNKGMFGKATAGYGSDDRYESSLLLNYFEDTQKVSLLASSNNINAVGFSMDEIFDNMGGGRNRSIWVNDNGSFGINGRSFGGDTGITKSNMMGLNFADEFFNKKMEASGSYFFSNTNTENKNRTNRINFLPTGNTNFNASSSSANESFGHNISTDIEIKIDSTSSLYLNPSFAKSNSKNKYKSNSRTLDETNDDLNSNEVDDFSESNSNEFSNNLYYYKSFKKKGRQISFSFDTETSNSNNDLKTINNTVFFQSGDPSELRDQIRNDESKSNNLALNFSYSEPVLDSISLGFEMGFRYKKNEDSQATFDYDSTSNSYSIFNSILSNEYLSTTSTFNPEVSIRLRKKKIRGSINLGTKIIDFKNEANYLATNTNVNKKYMYPSINGYVSYTIDKSKSIYSYYGYDIELPFSNQIIPIQNFENPLNTYIGNENLKPTENYNFYLNYNNYDYETRSGFFNYLGFNYYINQIVASTVYDDDFKAQTTYQNVDATLNSYFGASFNKSLKKEKRTFKYGIGFNASYRLDKGLTNAVTYESESLSITPKVNFSWSIDELITIAPTYKYTYRVNNFTNYIIDETSNFLHNFKLEFTSYWPKKVVFGSDFGYNYNSNISDGFQKDFYLWNLSLGYNFWQDQLLAKVKVYDVLNQNISNTRTITPTAITDSENTVLQQYVMFSLTYKLEKFGGKKKDDGQFIIID